VPNATISPIKITAATKLWVSNDVEKHAFLHVHIKEMYVKLVEESSVENNILTTTSFQQRQQQKQYTH